MSLRTSCYLFIVLFSNARGVLDVLPITPQNYLAMYTLGDCL